MPTRDTVEYNGDRYVVIDAAGTPTVYIVNGRLRGTEATGVLKAAVLAEIGVAPTGGERVRVAEKGTRPTNYAAVEVDIDTGELYRYTGR